MTANTETAIFVVEGTLKAKNIINGCVAMKPDS
jgi:hypothetical protein